MKFDPEALTTALGAIIKEQRAEIDARIAGIQQFVDYAKSAIEAQQSKDNENGSAISALRDEIRDSLAEIRDNADEAFESLTALAKEYGANSAEGLNEAIEATAQLIEERVERAQLDNQIWLLEAKNSLAELKQAQTRELESIETLRPINGQRSFSAGTFGAFLGSVYRAKKDAQQTPQQDPDAWQLVSAGISMAKIEHDDRNSYAVLAVGGEEQKWLIDRRMAHLGPYKEDTTYGINDIVMKDGSSWVSVVDENKTMPGEKTATPKWRLFGMKGAQGKAGKQGPRGEPGKDGTDGASIVDIQVSHNGIAFALSDGTATRASLDPLEQIVRGWVRAEIAEALK